MIKIALVLGFFWGVSYALVLQLTKYGKFLVQQRTWITVVLGVSVDIAIVSLVLPFDQVVEVCGVFALSAIGIIARSLYLEFQDIDAVKEYLSAKQD